MAWCHDEQCWDHAGITKCLKSDTESGLFSAIEFVDHAKDCANSGPIRIPKWACISFSMYKFDEVEECWDGLIFHKS